MLKRLIWAIMVLTSFVPIDLVDVIGIVKTGDLLKESAWDIEIGSAGVFGMEG